MNSLYAELIILARRPAVWMLLAVGTVLNLFVGYIAPYISYTGLDDTENRQARLQAMLPEQILTNVLEGFPFYVAMFGLILGVITLGSEYAQGTLKTSLMQHPSRIRLLLAKLAAISIVVLGLTLSIGLTSAVASAMIAMIEGISVQWPNAIDLVRGIGAGWLILLVWSFFGTALAVLTRGTSMAIGLGILYGLVIEGLVTAFGTDIALLQELSQGFLRANGYSVIQTLGASAPTGGEPGAFPGPFVEAWLAALILIGYLIVFTVLSAFVLRARDVA